MEQSATLAPELAFVSEDTSGSEVMMKERRNMSTKCQSDNLLIGGNKPTLIVPF
jgi:hypothetical protein